MKHRNSLTAEIRSAAKAVGFDLVGIAPADPLEGAEYFARWLALGYAGEMDYLERNRDKRTDPSQIVPGAKSVVCVGLRYLGANDRTGAPAEDPPTGRIAAYARGNDYHDVMKEKLATLWKGICEIAGPATRGRYSVDTAPVLERELAARAGLGWWGKNTCLIDRREGSYFFLGQIITDLQLEYDEPDVDHCGSCTRCLDACPTGAFPEPYVLDSRRCISYLTIELKGAIPVDLRHDMGSWIFGCDICQDVCPWNKQPTPAREPAFEPRDGLDQPSLTRILGMDRDNFNAQFRRNPVKRAKRRGLLRNTAVALGNSGSPAAVPALIRALKDEEPLVRGHAAWALGKLGGTEARTALGHALDTECESDVVAEIERAIEMLG